MPKYIRAALSIVLAVSSSLVVVGQITPEVGVTQSTKNPQQIAILHWYDANLTTTFTVGNGPLGMAFDGAHLWIANFFGNNVTKLETSTGKILGKFPAGVGPWRVAFDGANVWVTNITGDSVTKLRASDGKMLGTFKLRLESLRHRL